MAQLDGRCPVQKKVANSIPGQGHARDNWSMFLSHGWFSLKTNTKLSNNDWPPPDMPTFQLHTLKTTNNVRWRTEVSSLKLPLSHWGTRYSLCQNLSPGKVPLETYPQMHPSAVFTSSFKTQEPRCASASTGCVIWSASEGIHWAMAGSDHQVWPICSPFIPGPPPLDQALVVMPPDSGGQSDSHGQSK